jgi:hypothetical protein
VATPIAGTAPPAMPDAAAVLRWLHALGRRALDGNASQRHQLHCLKKSKQNHAKTQNSITQKHKINLKKLK